MLFVQPYLCSLAIPNMDPAEIQKIIDEYPRHLNVVILSEEDKIGNVLKNSLKEASDEKQKQMLSMFLTQLQIA